MAYFQDRTINLLNLHYAVRSIAMTGAGAFFAAYLVTADVSVPGVFASFAAILMGRFAIRPLILGLAARHGMRRLIIWGTLVAAAQYPFLPFVHGPGLPLAALIVLGAIADSLYWPCYHAYFASLGDDAVRGRQVSAREAIAALIGVASPLATGALLVGFGPQVAFGATAVVIALSALPLLRTPDVATGASVPGAFRASRAGVLLFVGDGFMGGIYFFVWRVALFLVLKENFMAFGGALAIAAIAGAGAGLLLGKHIDRGNGRNAVYIACGVVAAIIAFRALATYTPGLAVFANAVSAIGGCLYIPTLMSVVYTLGKAAPCPLRFQVAAEAGWDVGGSTSLLLSALLTWLGIPLWAVLLLGLVGIAWQFVLLRRHHAELATAHILGGEVGLAER
jgi:hypothetical protein